MHPKFWEESFELDPHNKLYQVGLSHNDPNGAFIGFLFPKFTDSLPKNLISYLALAILIKVLVLPQSLNLAGFYTFILNKQGCSYTHSYYNRHFNVTPQCHMIHEKRPPSPRSRRQISLVCSKSKWLAGVLIVCFFEFGGEWLHDLIQIDGY